MIENKNYGREISPKEAWAKAYPENPTIPRSFQIHHIDGDKNNNARENLIAIPREYHIYISAMKRLPTRSEIIKEVLSQGYKLEPNYFYELIFKNSEGNYYTFYQRCSTMRLQEDLKEGDVLPVVGLTDEEFERVAYWKDKYDRPYARATMILARNSDYGEYEAQYIDAFKPQVLN